MTDSTHISILRRMAGQVAAAPADSPLTTSRALRLALVKAASDAAGLVLAVGGTADDVLRLDDLLAGLDGGLMLVGLRRQGALAGFIAVDVQLRASILEMQLMGRVAGHAADERSATAADKVLCDPFLAAFLAALPAAVTGMADAGWIDGLALGDRLADSRAAGLLLADGDYRALRLSVALGKSDRQGSLLLVLPVPPQAVAEPLPVAARVDWPRAFAASVGCAPASLTARLHLFTLTLGQAQALQVGDVLPLLGCTVGSLRLIASDGRAVAQAKLGQLAGNRAVRITLAAQAQMQDLSGVGAVPAIALPVDNGAKEVLAADEAR